MSQPSQPNFIEVIGARTHCLKNFDIAIPQNQLVVICGRSGSGKSSLAIDTIFAEGQRQFLECQSIHSRQYFGQIPRADVDRIVGLPPTVCSKQQNSGGSPRSTVGTLTEVHDFLRVLFSQAGTVHCFQCGEAIEQATEMRWPPVVAQAEVGGAGAPGFIERLGRPLGVSVLGPRDERWLVRADDRAQLLRELGRTERGDQRLRIAVD